MVLMRLILRSLCLGSFLFFCFSGHTSKYFRAQLSPKIKNSSCIVRTKSGSNWILFSESLAPGTSIIAKNSEVNNEVILFKAQSHPRSLLAAKKECVLEDFNSSKKSLNTGESRHHNLFVSLFSWQEGLSLKFGATEYKLRGSNLAVCPGYTQIKRSGNKEFSLGICGFYAKATVSAADKSALETDLDDDNLEDPNPADWRAYYKASNVDVFGGFFIPGFHFRPSSEHVAFGIVAPIAVRYGVYPTASSTEGVLTPGPKLWFLAGLMLDSRFEIGDLYFSNKVGFFNKPSSIAWAVEGGWSF